MHCSTTATRKNPNRENHGAGVISLAHAGQRLRNMGEIVSPRNKERKKERTERKRKRERKGNVKRQMESEQVGQRARKKESEREMSGDFGRERDDSRTCTPSAVSQKMTQMHGVCTVTAAYTYQACL